MDQIEFCDAEKPLSCVSKTASNSTSGKLLFDVDVKKRIFKDKNDVDLSVTLSCLLIAMISHKKLLE